MRTKTEHEHQREFVSWFRQSYPTVRIFAIPNGGKRSPSEALRLKVEGVSAGVPDLFIPEWMIWIEFKTETGRVSTEQKEWILYLIDSGYKCLVAYGVDDGKEKLLASIESLLQ